MTYEIKQGDCLDVLKTLESESVQMCCTSPPYYGLRSYKTDPQIWDGDPKCDHIWTDKIKPAANGLVNNVMQGETLDGNSGTRSPQTYSVCSCGAWRGELGLEPTFQLYISHLIQIFAEVKRVLKPDGCVFVNLGDSYASSGGASRHFGYQDPKYKNGRDGNHVEPTAFPQTVRPKSLLNIPHRFFIAMTDELQMIQRNNINWWKRACMPSSAKDRWTVDFESIGFFTKNAKYKFNQDLEAYTKPLDRWGGEDLVANGEGDWDKGTGQSTYRDRNMRPNPDGRNARTTWDIGYEPSGENHYASYPTKLAEKMILASTDESDIVLDIFAGTCSTGHAALRNKRHFIGVELNPEYIEISRKRLAEIQVKLFT